MSVVLTSLNEEYELNIANGTWATLIRHSPIKPYFALTCHHDPIHITEAQAKQCAQLLQDWTPPENWFCSGNEHQGKAIIIDFFKLCNGFRSS